MNKNPGRATELFFIALLAFTLLTCGGGDEKALQLSATVVSSTEIRVTWNIPYSAEEDCLFANCNWEFRILENGLPHTANSGTSFLFRFREPNTRYCYQVIGYINKCNWLYGCATHEQERSNEVCVTTPQDLPPSAPTNPFVVAVSPGKIDISWDASTDDYEVSSYKIYRDRSFLKSVLETSTFDTCLVHLTEYCYSVSAIDNSGNESERGNEVCATTPEYNPISGKPALLVGSNFTDSIFRYDGTTGEFIDEFVPAGSGGLNAPWKGIIGPDDNLYVCSALSNSVLRYDSITGAFIDVFVPSNSGGLVNPHGLIFGPDGNLYVTSSGSDEILRYDGTTGAFINAFVTSGSGGLDAPLDLVFGVDGNLYVGGFWTNSVFQYDGTTGTFIDEFVPTGSGGLTAPHGLIFGVDGNLYVSSNGTGNILRYDGTTGEFIDEFVPTGSGGLAGPIGLTFGQDGNLYVSSFYNSILRYDGVTGDFIDEFVSAESCGLDGPMWPIFAYPE